MKFDLTKMATFGVAGNFTGHLEQAGEASDFVNVKTKEAIAPKAMFPTYIPFKQSSGKECKNQVTPAFLSNSFFDENKIIYPAGEQKIQLEPECAIIFDVKWNDGKVEKLSPLFFGASNDCSIRKEGAKKISQKKNWGESSKGFSSQLISIDRFDAEGILNRYRIASFMIRGNEVFTYGEDSAVRDYSYMYEKLNEWMIEKLNGQKDEGPAENINSYLNEAGCPEQIMISIGATRYTEFGETNFLNGGDESVVILYPEDKYTFDVIKSGLEKGISFDTDVSVLRQKIVL